MATTPDGAPSGTSATPGSGWVRGGWVRDGNVRVCFAELGEGLNGEYDPDDPDDVELLRLDVHVHTASGYDGEPTGDPGWRYPDDGSACTGVPVDTPDAEQHQLLTYAASVLAAAVAGGRSVKHAVGELSWLPHRRRDRCGWCHKAVDGTPDGACHACGRTGHDTCAGWPPGRPWPAERVCRVCRDS